MEKERVHEGRDCSVGIRDLGGCVEGVSMSFVRAVSSGARMIPAIPAALTAAIRLAMGEGDERISKPPIADGIGIKYGGCE